MEIKKGGKRVGAGRKPIAEKKKPITVYIKGGTILKFGSEGAIKIKLVEYAEAYKENCDGINTNVNKLDEAARYELPKSNYFAPTPIEVTLTKRQVYINELNECRDYDEIKKVMIKVKADTLSNLDRQMINLHVTTVMEEKGIVVN